MTMVRRHLENVQGSLKPIRLHTFTEELPVDYLGCRVVEPDSAKIPGYNSETIHANHMEMTKFNSKDDPGYVKVLDRLKVWTGDDDSSIGLKYIDELRLKFENLSTGIKLAKSEPPSSAIQLCESSNIEHSLKWFMDSREYQAWKYAGASKLWLHGRKGDGKTVIMSYVLRSLSEHSDKQNIASIFCSCNDSEEGVLASIAIQLLQNKDRAEATRSMFPIFMFQSGFILPLRELVTTLIGRSRGLVLIIDGIDKLDFPIRSSFLHTLGKLEKGLLNMDIRVLISSQTIDDIQSAIGHYSSIDREKERKEFLNILQFQEWNAREIGVQDVKAAGTRFFGLPEYHNWIQSGGPSTLWLEGKPGSGKSTLVKFMVKELENDAALRQGRQVVPYQESNLSHSSQQKGNEEWMFNNPDDKSFIIGRFYYSFRGGNTQTSHELMLRSIVYQIWSKNSKLFPLIRHRYRQWVKNTDVGGEQKPVWSYDFLKLTLESLREANLDLSIFIIVDGMDESNNDKRVDTLNLLLSLTQANPTGSCIIKVFVASRPENNINSRLRRVHHHIKLQEVNQEDIRMVVEGWIKLMVSEGECEEATLLEVKNYIITYSDGVFMWVTLVLRDLQQYIANGGYTKLTLDTRLRSLPKELGGKDGFYRAMVNSLVENYKEDQEYQELGRRIFVWVTFAERPMSVTELRDALATPTRLDRTGLSTYVLEDNRPHQLERAILSYCGGLVEIRNSVSGGIVQLIHQTAREFLLNKDKLAEPYHLEEVKGDAEIAMACCWYLSIVFSPDFPPGEASAVLPNVETVAEHLSDKSLLLYALQNFEDHLDHLGENGGKVRDEFMNFVKLLIKRRHSYASLLLGQWIKTLKWPTELQVDEISVRLCLRILLSCASETWNEKLAKVLLLLRSDLLHIEAGKGHPITMKQQIENGPEVTPQSIGGRTPFTATNDHRGGLIFLIDIGLDPDLLDTASRTPLSYAAENGHVSSLGQLLERGADYNVVDSFGQTPMSYAVQNGQEGSLRLLIKYGRITEDMADRTLLSHAAKNKQEGTLKLLLEHGARVNKKDTDGRTALSYAAANGDEDCVKLLLEKMADASTEDISGRTPVSYATANGHMAVVKLLESYITT